MNKTQIEWTLNPDGTPGYTWNPITGCLNGCEYCYARRLANTRLKDRYLLNPKVADIKGQLHDSESPLWNRVVRDPFYPRFWEDRLAAPFMRVKPTGIFVCDMSDLFGIGIPDEWTREVMRVIRVCPQHRFYLLTKQPQNFIKFSPFPDHCYIGVTATDAKSFLEAGRELEKIEAKVKYISFEPLLAHIGGLWFEGWLKSGVGIKWVIIGAQTKPYKPPKIEWVQEIVEACDKAGVKVFLKKNLKPLIDKSSNVVGLTRYGSARLRQEMPK